MTQSSIPTPQGPQPTLSMFDVYSGYVLTQGRNALMYVMMWERVMRFAGICALVVMGTLWVAPGNSGSAAVFPLKLVLSIVLLVLSITLFWAARCRPQYECQIDLIHCEFRQVLRAASGIENLLMAVRFDEVDGLFVRRNRATPGASCLFMEVRGAPEALLLGVSDDATLDVVHRRISADLAKARTMAQPPRRTPHQGDDAATAAGRMQVA